MDVYRTTDAVVWQPLTFLQTMHVPARAAAEFLQVTPQHLAYWEKSGRAPRLVLKALLARYAPAMIGTRDGSLVSVTTRRPYCLPSQLVRLARRYDQIAASHLAASHLAASQIETSQLAATPAVLAESAVPTPSCATPAPALATVDVVTPRAEATPGPITVPPSARQVLTTAGGLTPTEADALLSLVTRLHADREAQRQQVGLLTTRVKTLEDELEFARLERDDAQQELAQARSRITSLQEENRVYLAIAESATTPVGAGRGPAGDAGGVASEASSHAPVPAQAIGTVGGTVSGTPSDVITAEMPTLAAALAACDRSLVEELGALPKFQGHRG